MRPDVTPAVERALAAAARWHGPADGNSLGMPQVLLGLLSESECRAAAMLARHGVTQATVKRRWPGLKRSRSQTKPAIANVEQRWRPVIRRILATALARLSGHGPSLAIA